MSWTSSSFRSFLIEYQDAYVHHIPASIIAHACKVSPGITEEDYQRTIRSSLHKEISASITRSSGARLDFRCVFSPIQSDRTIPFSNRFPSNEEVASDTYKIFASSRDILTNMLVYPSLGTKTVGSIVKRNFWDTYYAEGCTFKHEEDVDFSYDVTPLDCLRMYEETGGYVPGPVEMRHAWKYNNLNPRVYFARGGDVIPISQYIQPIINRLVDMFPEVHRMNRFAPSKEPLTSADVEIIYDYTSFTSSIDQVIEFVDCMADFYSGTPITLIDVRNGPTPVDLGELLRQYNYQCNHYASFDTSKVFPDLDDPPILQHTCGMLGVEGNIFLATLLHGIHLRFISGLGRSRCVGDDARAHHNTGTGMLNEEDGQLVSWQISGIGEVHADKLGKFEVGQDPSYQAYRYVKRPIHRDQDIMVEGVLLTIPSLIPMLPIADRFHTITPSSTHPCRQTFNSIIRFFRVLVLHSISYSNTDPSYMSMLVIHVRFLLRRVREMDPEGLHAPFARGSNSTPYLTLPNELWGVMDYQQWLLDDLWNDEEIRFLSRGGGDSEMCDGRIGSVMRKDQSKGRSFLVKLGYLRSERLYDVVSLSQIGREEMKVYIDGDYTALERYEVVRTIPSWYATLPRVL